MMPNRVSVDIPRDSAGLSLSKRRHPPIWHDTNSVAVSIWQIAFQGDPTTRMSHLNHFFRFQRVPKIALQKVKKF
jgi:hypothetical protein